MKKLRNKGGFTLVEMLCALLVLVLASAAMIMEISFATRTYKESMDVSNAQVLCSTLSATAGEELRYADGTPTTDVSGNLQFSSIHYGSAAFSQDENGQVKLGEEKILSPAAYPNGLKGSVELSYKGNAYTVSIKVTSAGGAELAKNTFVVEPLGAKGA